ncbi:MAG: ABC transporter ATP-binding protein [Chloroflexi bacterium]|nr:ABC transporter ATP-binding protein [Chloroflexota bacterium]
MGELEVRNLTKYVDGRLVIDRVSFRVNDGEFFVVLGPAGSGKSVLLRLIGGLDQPDEGQVLIDGQDVTMLPPGQRNIAMALQNNYGLYPRMDVYQNIAFGIRNQHLDSEGVEMRVVAAAHTVGIGHLLKRKATDLPGEDQRHIVLARMLAKKAALYLFDEWPQQLTTSLRYQARQDMLMVHRKGYQASIYFTSDQMEGLAIAHRAALLVKGSIQQIGTRDELISTPANAFVAGFVGSPPMNILPGYLQNNYKLTDLKYRIRARGVSPILSSKWNCILQSYDHPNVLLGIRPDLICPDWTFPDLLLKPDYITQATIIEVEPHPKSAVVKLEVEEGDTIMAVFYAPSLDRIRIGHCVTIGLHTEKLYLFHPVTGQPFKLGSA